MPSSLLTPPAVEPISLAEAKLYLRVEQDDDDALIASLIADARMHVELSTHRALIAQTWRFVHDAWPSAGWLALPKAPLRQLIAARFYDAQNVAHTIDPQAFVVDTAGAVLGFVPWGLPPPGRRIAGIEIDVELGYGAAAADVPQPLRQAIRMMVALRYEHRSFADTDKASTWIEAIQAQLAPYRVLSLW
jgi:uncharacterized phiE125 gp8 family phage protein